MKKMNQKVNDYFLKNISSKDFSNFIIEWNIKFPFDRWWRKKYNVAFNSLEHRKMSLIDIKYEYEEERVLKNYFKKRERLKKEKEDYLLTGEILKVTQKDESDLFDMIDFGSQDEGKVSV